MIMLSTPALLNPRNAATRRAPRTVLVVGAPDEWNPYARTALGGDPRLALLGVVDSPTEALALVPNLQPDVVLVDADALGGESSAGVPEDPTHDPAHALARRLAAMARTGRTILTGTGDGLHRRRLAQSAHAAYLPKHTLTAERLLSLA